MGYPEVVLADSPVAYWRLNESAAPFADSMNTFGTFNTPSGTITPGSAGGLIGSSAKSLNFGGGHINGPGDAALAPTLISFEFLLYPTNQINGNVIMCKAATAGGNPSDWWAQWSGTGLQMGLMASGSMNFWMQTVTGAVSTNAWHHFCMTFDNTTLRLYLDGALSASTTTTSGSRQSPASTTPIQLMSLQGSSISQGSLQEIAIYNKALAASRVQAHYNEARLRGGVSF